MNREVYIDGRLVDMIEGNEPGIVFNNPIFVDASQIKVNRTTTFTIPITDKNRAILGYTDNVNVESSFPRNQHVLEEYRDGLPIIRNAQAKLLSIGEQYEFSVTWGILKNVQESLKVKINELPAIPPLAWDGTTQFYRHLGNLTARPNYTFLRTQTFTPYDQEVEDEMKYHFPSINILYLMDLIAQHAGLKFNYGLGVSETIRDYYIPILTKKRDASSLTDVNAATSAQLWHDGTGIWTIPPQSRYKMNRDPLGVLDYTEPDSDPDRNIGAILLPNGSYKIQVNLSATSTSGFFANYDEAVVYLLTKSGNGDNEEQSIRIDKQSNNLIVGSGEVNLEIDNVSGRSILGMFVFVRRYGGDFRRIPINYDVEQEPRANVTLLIWRAEGDVVYANDDFPIITNLPDISSMDFIKDMCFFFGMYIQSGNNDTLNFELTDNIIRRQLSPNIIENELIQRRYKSQSFSLLDYARVNEFNYADDERVRINANGSISISDLSLDERKEVFELKFAPSDMSDRGMAIVELFDKQIDDEGVVTYDYIGESLTPRILKFVIRSGQSMPDLQFTPDMNMQNIIDTRYRLVGSLIQSAKIVSLDVYLDNIRLYRFNELDVFYFYGTNWIMISGTVSNSILSGEFVHFPQLLI